METSVPGREEIIAELTENFLEMLRRGDSVTPESYAAEHPDYTSELMELLPSLVQVEDLGKSSGTAARSVFDYPKSLGDYQLGEKLGSGGMGTVFLIRGTARPLKTNPNSSRACATLISSKCSAPGKRDHGDTT